MEEEYNIKIKIKGIPKKGEKGYNRFIVKKKIKLVKKSLKKFFFFN
tara:strand:+ start:82 stop:219 length:138 start_codon:yes stop_codon:yes gene_type:complete